MADNVTLQTTPATPLAGTKIATVEGDFSGETVQAGVGALIKVTGSEGSRSFALVDPATEGKQDTGNTSLASIDGKTPALVGGAVPVTGPLTDTELRATPVPVSGTVATGGLTDAQLRASAVPVSTADGAQATIGAQANARSTATDTTAVTAMSVWKQISFSIQAAAAALATFVFGPGTAAAAQRTTLASDDPAVAALGAPNGAAVITDADGTLQQYLRGLIKLAITTANYPSRAFVGTAQTVISTATDIAAGNFSGAPAATFDNTSDAAVPMATQFLAMAEFPDWAATPGAGTTVSLYLVFLNTDGTDDDTDAPTGTANGGGYYVGSWIIAAADALQRRTIGFSIPPGITAFDAYIKNETAQNMNNDGGTSCVVKITPIGIGPVV